MTRSLFSEQFRNIELENKSYSLENQYLCFYLALLYIEGYALGFETDIMINFNLWSWNLILDELMYTI